MSNKKEWLVEARAGSRIENQDIAIDRWGHVFHEHELRIPELEEMSESTLEEVEAGVAPCSECFPTLFVHWKSWKQKQIK